MAASRSPARRAARRRRTREVPCCWMRFILKRAAEREAARIKKKKSREKFNFLQSKRDARRPFRILSACKSDAARSFSFWRQKVRLARQRPPPWRFNHAICERGGQRWREIRAAQPTSTRSRRLKTFARVPPPSATPKTNSLATRRSERLPPATKLCARRPFITSPPSSSSPPPPSSSPPPPPLPKHSSRPPPDHDGALRSLFLASSTDKKAARARAKFAAHKRHRRRPAESGDRHFVRRRI